MGNHKAIRWQTILVLRRWRHPVKYGDRHGLWLDHEDYIKTWSRDYQVYAHDNTSFDDARYALVTVGDSPAVNSTNMGLSSKPSQIFLAALERESYEGNRAAM